MDKDRKGFDPSSLVSTAGQVSRETVESLAPRPSRSKRGLSNIETSQICFRVPKEAHHALKVYCLENRLEVGEAMERALAMLLSTGPGS